MEASQQQPAPSPRVAVYGAHGHTARFVTAELVKRDLRPVLSGRDASKVEVAAADVGASEFHVAVVDDPADNLTIRSSRVTPVVEGRAG